MLSDSFDTEIIRYNLQNCNECYYNSLRTIYHYTSPEGLIGILQQNNPVLWFSRYDILNDTAEGKNVMSVYRKACNKLLNSKEISKRFYDDIYNLEIAKKTALIYKEAINNTIHGKYTECDKYICSFSKNGDSLPMWNYYVKNNKFEGFNIGFTFFANEYDIHKTALDNGYSIEFYSVIYDENQKLEIIKKKILNIYSAITNYDKQINRVQTHLMNVLNDYSLIFKTECFKHEEEVRAIIELPREQNIFEIKYRTKNGYIIPYISFELSKVNICEINIGPLLKDDSCKKNIADMLLRYNYHPCRIKSSAIPIRY